MTYCADFTDKEMFYLQRLVRRRGFKQVVEAMALEANDCFGATAEESYEALADQLNTLAASIDPETGK
jgi:hypothetical protein